ncbi:hypothetical protein [Mycoplasmopsis gallopavonis]|uniref:hypothetical protein n=1 Tax=Mycoplasmopsis gallopavonis TaxID=76629 RepID=UPI000E67EC9F|nr:hypothetical protein [Mycoplasmopsis gallopavonis]RIV16213.1 hypothetical protein D1113_03175 [Mycoplasmopsis gallopavonis]
MSFYLDNSKIEEKIVSIPNEQETIDLTAFIPEGYKLAQGQENIVDYSSELRINLSKITKLVTFEFMLENNTKVGSYQANFLPETTTVNLDLRQIPHDFVLVENIQEFAINDVIRVTVRPKYKYFTLVFEVNKQKVEEKMNLKIDFLANKIDLTQYLPIGMKLANNQETMVEYQPGVVVQVVYIKKDSQVIYYDIDSQKVVSTISKKVEYNVNQIDVQSELPNGYFLAPGQKEVVDFANQIRVNITKNNPGSSENVNEEPITNHESNSEVVESENLHAFSLIKDNYSLFDMRNLNDRFHNLENKITDIDHLNNTELSSLNQELNSFLITLEEQIKSNWTNKQEEIKQLINNFASQNYYMDDFSALLETLNSSFETQNSKTNLVRFYVLNNLKFQDLKQQIIEFKNQVDSFDLSSGDVRQGGRYNIFVNLNYPRPTGAEYIIGTNSKVQVQLTFQDKNNSQAIFNLKHLKKYLSENKLKLQAKFGVRTSKFYEIALDQIDFASNSIFLNYSSTTNEEWILKFNLQNINHSTISYNTYDKKDQSFNIFVRSGNNPDQTPNRSEVTPNSLADYWLFPSTYKIQFREKLETEGANEATLRKLNSYIQENGKTSWNTKISNGQAFSYQDALWIAFLNFFKQANFANNDFTLEENQTLFTKPFDTNGSFSFQFSAIANQAKAIGSLNYFGGSFFEVAFLSSHLASYKLQSQDRLKIIFSLNNQGDSWKQGYKANALPVLINNSNGNLTPLRFLGFNGKYPFLANIYGNFTLQVFVNDSKIYELSSNQANNTHVFPIFVLNKNQTDGQGVIDVYTSGTRSAIG